MSTKIEKEFELYESQQSWNQVYQKLKNDASLASIHEKHTVGEARKPENRSKNRYRDVSPYDHSRVVLQSGESDYINASIINVPESKRKYILSQGPLEHTAAQFWQMVWEQKSKAIIMLNKVIEKGTMKCYQYWPLIEDADDEDEMIFKETHFKVTIQKEQEYEHFTIRTFELENMQTTELREVYHFHYTLWPDFGIPNSPFSFLMFLEAVRGKGVLHSEYGPAVIHCSAGIGRSGTFCLVDSALVLVEETGTMDDIDVCSLLLTMRSYRMGLIQTPDQLKFSYMAIIEGAKRILNLRGAEEINDMLEVFISKQVKAKPPPPPKRNESLSPTKSNEPSTTPRKHVATTDIAEETISKQPKLDNSNIPQSLPNNASNDETYSIAVTGMDVVNDKESFQNENAIKKPFMNENNDEISTSAQLKEVDSENNNPIGGKEGGVRHRLKREEGVESTSKYGYEEKPVKIAPTVVTQQHLENSVSPESSDAYIKQRRKEERLKRIEATQDMIQKMREKQHKSETWKKRKSYFKPIVIGFSIIIGAYLLYRICW